MFNPPGEGHFMEVFRDAFADHLPDDVIYTESPVFYIVYRVRQHLQQYPASSILLVIPQGTQTKTALEMSFTSGEAQRIQYLQWGNLIPRHDRRKVMHAQDLCIIYATLEQVEFGQTYIEHIKDRTFMWGMFSPQVEYVRKVVK